MSIEPAAGLGRLWASSGHWMIAHLTAIEPPFAAFFDPESWVPVTPLALLELCFHWRLCGEGHQPEEGVTTVTSVWTMGLRFVILGQEQ